MTLLNSWRFIRGHTNAQLSSLNHFSAGPSRHTNSDNPFSARDIERAKHIFGVAADRNSNGPVTRFSQGVKLTRKNEVITIVIGDCCNGRAIPVKAQRWPGCAL